MAPRRETRREAEAFLARLEGRSLEDRHRLAVAHREYLDGKRSTDVVFEDGDGAIATAAAVTSAPTPSTTAPATISDPATTASPSPYRAALPRRPPMGKNAAYLAAAKKKMKDRLAAEASTKKSPGKKRISKTQRAALAREEKKTVAAQMIDRAVVVVARRANEKTRGRARVAEEEKRGVEARAEALLVLAAEKKKKRGTKKQAAKKQKTASPHIVDSDGDEVADDESVASGARSPASSTSQTRRQPARSLTMGTADPGPSSVVATVASIQNHDDGALNSDLEGEGGDSDDWYIEGEGLVAENVSIEDDDSDARDEVEIESQPSDSDDGFLDSVALLNRRKKKLQRQRQRDHLKSSIAKLSRSWETTTTNWDSLTKEEMQILANDETALKKMRADGWEFDTTKHPERLEPYPGLYSGGYGPTEAVLEAAESPLSLFFFFMPRRLWRRIATESNRYYHQHLNERVNRIYGTRVEGNEELTREEVLLQETKKHKKIAPEDVVHCIGLLIARMLCPHKRRFADHWATKPVGAVPKGTFGSYKGKSRFERIMQNLHFTDNTDARAETDRAWKVRSVVDTLQHTFARGYKVPPVLSFDEAMIPSRSRHNITRQFMKDKPHKWGTKLFMTCCATTAYCLRLEVFCGTDQHTDELGGDSHIPISADPNSGPAAVIRNLEAVLPGQEEGVYHTVVTDRFYTSIQLAMQLLARNVYTVGTIQTNKKGFPPNLITSDATRPSHIERGTSTIAVAKCCNLLQVMRWWDRLPVYLLSTGHSTTIESCGRHLSGGRRSIIPCPSAMRDYHRWMGGVDIHDQLRLQRYSLQLSVRFRKYYKTIFLGLVDIAIVNAFIIYREVRKQAGEPAADHAEFLSELQAQLLQVTSADFVEEIFSPVPSEQRPNVSAEHKLTEFPEWTQVREGVRKRPQHQCKVCSIRKQKIGQRSATRFYCEACSDGNRRVYLCDRIRPGHYPGNTMTCHQIWHVMWKNGEERPHPRVGRGIQMRSLGKKRRRHSSNEEGGDSGDSGDEEGGEEVVGDNGGEGSGSEE